MAVPTIRRADAQCLQFEEAAAETRYLAHNLVDESSRDDNEEEDQDSALIPAIPTGSIRSDAHDLQRLSLLAQVQALAFNSLLGAAKTERDIRAAHRLLNHPERGPLKLQETARRVMVEQLDASEGTADSTDPLAKELKASLDRCAYSIERSVAKAVEKVVTARTMTIEPSTNEAAFQLRHAGLQLLFCVSEVDQNAIWERVGRYGHGHMRSCFEASRAAAAQEMENANTAEASSTTKAKNGKGKESTNRWARESFPVVHEAFQDSVRNAETQGKLDVKCPGFEKLVEVWTSLAQKVRRLRALKTVRMLIKHRNSAGWRP